MIKTVFKKILYSFTIIFLASLFWQTGRVKAAPPTNFQSTPIITTGLNFPTGFAFAPDGRIFILERAGAVRVYKNGTLLTTPFVTLPSATTGDRGLTGIVFDPNFTSNHYVYFYYTSSADLHNRLVRYDASGDTATGNATVLYETLTPSQLLHIGGTVQFGLDGKIYLSIGDNGTPGNSQDLSNPFGKIIRLNPDGSIPSDNPFVGQIGNLPEIWAYGLRNPFRFQFDPVTGEMFAGDVGQASWEEMNHIIKGHNYGWPLAEGNCSGCGFEDPLYTYAHDGQSSSITGGPVYRADMFPAEYYGSVFFGDYARGFIKRLTFSIHNHADGTNHAHLGQVFDFDPGAGSVVDLKTHPDGSFYYLTIFPGRLYRVTYLQSNQTPTAQASADQTEGLPPLTVNFSSAGSFDPDNDPLTYLWDFGDGTTSTAANPTKEYDQEGAFVVDLTVSDGVNQVDAVPIIIQVGTPPDLVIAAPTNGDTFRAGDIVAYAAHATDAAGFDLPEQNYTLEARFHHGTHIHPFLGPITSQNGQFTIPSGIEPATDVSYEVIFTARDSKGLSTTESVSIFPELSSFTLESSPSGATIIMDDIPATTPQNFDGIINYQRELEAPLYQKIGGRFYKFVLWSDGGERIHNIVVSETPQTFTVFYEPVQDWVAEYYDDRFLTPPANLILEETAVDFDWQHGGPAPGLPADNFSARFTKTESFTAGTYRFTARSDDGIRVFVDGTAIIDKWFDQAPTTYIADLALFEGNHTVVVEYYENGGGAVAELSYVQTSTTPPPSPTPPPPPTSRFLGEYWNWGTGANPPFPTVAPDLTRTDAVVDFDWGGGSPGSPINTDHFVARWTKTESFVAGSFLFTVRADDGVRLYLDNNLIINKWIDQGPTTYTTTQALTDGDHIIKMEYYENGGGAVAELSYTQTSTTPPPSPTPPPPPPTGSYNAEYFSNGTLTGAPALTRSDAVIDFDWDGGSPDPLIPVDNFSARWTKTESFVAGSFLFTVRADDGVRLYLDNNLIINKWIDQGPTTYTTTQALTDGDHIIKMEYYENGGGAVAELSYVQTSTTPPPSPTPPPPPTSRFLGEYWNWGTGANPPFPTVAPDLTRTDAVVDFDWGGGSPGSPINTDHFVARWTKTESFVAGSFLFTVRADDGVRLYLDNNLIINKWIDQGPTTYTTTQALTDGDHIIKMEYYENGGGAVAELSYTQTSTTPPPSPTPPPPPPTSGFLGEYWNWGTGPSPSFPTITPTLSRTDATIDFNWDRFSPDPSINNDHFVVRWLKTAVFEDASYQFTTRSDDGVRVYIDGVLVLDKWIDQGPTTYQATKAIIAGDHEIKVEYYENGGGAEVSFSYVKL